MLERTSKTSVIGSTFGILGKRPNRMLLISLMLSVFGVVAIYSTVPLTRESILLIGGLLIAAGISQVALAVNARKFGIHSPEPFLGLVNAVVGILIIMHPAAAVGILSLLIVVCLILTGSFPIAVALDLGGPNLIWVMMHGVVSLLLGLLIVLQWPFSGSWLIVLFVCIDVIFYGSALTALGAAQDPLPLGDETPVKRQ